jgi:tetratricopeptide (TPR) repeat protein
MKVVHKNIEPAMEAGYKGKGWLERAKEAEAREDLEEAAVDYAKVIKADALNEFAYNRLLVIYRKQKEYKKELDLLNTGIAAYEKFFASHYKEKPAKVNAISKKLNKALGLIDKKGNNVYNPPPLDRWKKRRVLVKKRLK